MKITIDTSYTQTNSADIELPIENWSEVKDYYIKWDTLYYTLDDEKWEELDLNSVENTPDCKRPDNTVVYDENFNTLNEK